MAHGERAAALANWRCGREYWSRRPLSGSPGGRQRGPSIKTLTHRIERARAKVQTRKLVNT